MSARAVGRGLALLIVTCGLLSSRLLAQFQDYAVDVQKTGSVVNPVVGGSTGYSAQFKVYNNGLYPDTYSLSCSGSHVVCTGLSQSTVSPSPGGHYVTVTAYYNVTTGGTGIIGLSANGGAPQYVSDYDQFTFTINSYLPQVTPDGASGSPATENYGGAETFTVKNIGTATATYNLSCSGSTSPVNCASTNPTSVTLAPSGTAGVTANYNAGLAGTGTLELRAVSTIGTEADVGTYSVLVIRYGVAVTPDGGTVTRAVNGSYSESFTVQNTGTAQNTYTLVCGHTGTVTGCTSPQPVTLAAGASTGVPVSYTTSADGSGSLSLTASSGSGNQYVSDGGIFTVNLVG